MVFGTRVLKYWVLEPPGFGLWLEDGHVTTLGLLRYNISERVAHAERSFHAKITSDPVGVV